MSKATIINQEPIIINSNDSKPYDRREYHKEYEKQNRDYALALIGDSCIVCGSKKVLFHKKDGKPHKNTTAIYYLKHYKDFIPLCAKHHRELHSRMRIIKQQNCYPVAKIMIFDHIIYQMQTKQSIPMPLQYMTKKTRNQILKNQTRRC